MTEQSVDFIKLLTSRIEALEAERTAAYEQLVATLAPYDLRINELKDLLQRAGGPVLEKTACKFDAPAVAQAAYACSANAPNLSPEQKRQAFLTSLNPANVLRRRIRGDGN